MLDTAEERQLIQSNLSQKEIILHYMEIVMDSSFSMKRTRESMSDKDKDKREENRDEGEMDDNRKKTKKARKDDTLKLDRYKEIALNSNPKRKGTKVGRLKKKGQRRKKCNEMSSERISTRQIVNRHTSSSLNAQWMIPHLPEMVREVSRMLYKSKFRYFHLTKH